MTSRERFLTAMTGGKPDRVPCTPDFSNMIPCRLTGKPFWEIYLNGNPPLWKAYLHAADYFGIDAWFFNGGLDFQYPDNGVKWEHKITSRTDERIVQRHYTTMPEGTLESETTFYRADPPSPTEKPIKDIKKDVAKFRRFFEPPTGYTTDSTLRQKDKVGEHAFGTCVGFPGFQVWHVFVQGGIEPLAYAEADEPGLLEELCDLQTRQIVKQTEMIIDSKQFDFILLGGSGAITMQSPALFDKYSLPCIKQVTRMCKQAGLPTMLHSCSKETHLVKRCADETDLDCVNPLEIPPMGDCDLAELKRLYGSRIALMGNLHTTDVMLRGTVDEVERAARKCIDDAAEGGGFILSTGDQCGRDTPVENLWKLVEVCKTYGKYE
ncbi:MAG TPA: uroporphyrinogen decarboxylase family protein [Planctomycetota bacterium]|nr:uroporphyrinogen decarboxylase family protein [Planctomycetota bacterium]